MPRFPLTRRFASLVPPLAGSVLAALALSGCGGGSNSSTGTLPVIPPVVTPAAEAVYVADAGKGNIPVVGIAANGTPFQLGSPAGLPSGSTPQDLILDPSRQFVLVASSGTPRLSAYKINADGSLPATPAQSATLPSLTTLTHSALAAAVTAQGEFIYVIGSGQNAIYAFQLNTTTGALTSVPNAAPTTGAGATLFPASVATFGLSQGLNSQPYLLVGETSPNVTEYTINPNGTLSEADSCVAGETGPVYVAAPADVIQGDASFNKVYAYDNQVRDLYVYTIGSNGAMTMLPSIPGPSTISSFTIYPNSNGGALYLTQQGGPSLYEYTLDPNTGLPPATPVTTTVAGAQLSGAVIDQAGLYLGVVDATLTAPRVVVYSLNGKSVGGVVATYSLSTGSDPVAAASLILTAMR